MILDEPTLGIDPIQVAQTRQLIKDLGEEHTILISSHILPEVSMICDRVVIIHEGQIVAEDRIENLSTLLRGTWNVQLEVKGPINAVTKKLQQVRGVSGVRYEKPYHIVECPADQDLRGSLMRAIVQGGWTILSMGSVDMSLEDIFLRLTTEEESPDDEELEE
jgi:ABC-2 type transport system ATP-binding protein